MSLGVAESAPHSTDPARKLIGPVVLPRTRISPNLLELIYLTVWHTEGLPSQIKVIFFISLSLPIITFLNGHLSDVPLTGYNKEDFMSLKENVNQG